MIPFRISYASSYASGDTLRPAPPPESDLPSGTLHHSPLPESDVPRVAPVLLENAASVERPPWVPTVPIPPEVLQMPFGEVIERIPWLPVLLQQHLYEYNPRYLYREHPELFHEDFEEGMRLDLYAPTFDLADNERAAQWLFRERQDRYRATAERDGVPPVLQSFNEVHWNRGRGDRTSSRPSGPTPTPNQNAGQGEHNLPPGTVIVSLSQPTTRMIELIARHYQQKTARAAARDDDRRRDKERRDAYRNLYIAQWASDVYSSRKRKSDELQAEHRQEKKVKTELDDGRGGYNQPTEAGRDGYNQPTETGRDGYNQPTEAGRGGYWPPAEDDLTHLAHLARMARSALRRLPPNSPAPDGRGGYN
ncbi:hypothetical protein F4821DRAFT_265238 [Hypoxylon rubiginosum]|uniref:Uncharacterized protein n=1 Tax=Hypoxylon rubiginosum TaxID=110542 RepID=A0ACC0CL89_9PEZI|nr:hypothetical protein F4821DRAFT_265238 [Hypoxylon rubiginosum]